MSVACTVKTELKLAGVWTDVTADTLARLGLTFRYGMADGKPTTRVATTGEAKLFLNNAAGNTLGRQGAYSPNNANVRTGFMQTIPARISFTYSGTTYYKFAGRLKGINPLPGMHGEQYTACTALDYMDDLARGTVYGVTPQVSKRYDQCLTSLLTYLSQQPFNTSFDAGISTFVYAMVGGTNGIVNALQECARLANSELGYIYVKGDTSTGGVLTGESRHSRLLRLTSLATLSDTMGDNAAGVPGLVVPSTLDEIINQVNVTVHPRKADASPVVLYSSVTAPTANPPSVDTGAIITINGPYRDPSSPFSTGSSRVAGTSMVAPVAGVDYVANSDPSGSGTDLTASLSVSALLGATGVTFTIQNNSAQRAYLKTLQVRGLGLYDYDAAIAISEDTSSETTYGANSVDFDMPYEADPINGKGAGDAIRILWSTPFAYAQQVSFIANIDDAHMTAALAREIGDRVTINETVTGVSGDFFINGIAFNVSDGPWIVCTWTLAPASDSAYWILGQAGNSELGQTTWLAPF